MKGRNNSGSNTPLFSEEEFKKMAEHSQFTEEDLRRLAENAYVPPQGKVVRIDQEHDVLYYAAEEDHLNEPEKSISPKNSDSPTKQSSSTQQIYNTLRNSLEALDFTFPDMKDGFSYKGKEMIDRPMQRIENDIPTGYKKMTMWCHDLQSFCIGTVPEGTPELTSEELEKYRSMRPNGDE